MDLVDKIIEDFVNEFTLKDRLFSDITDVLIENIYECIINNEELVIENNLSTKLLLLTYIK